MTGSVVVCEEGQKNVGVVQDMNETVARSSGGGQGGATSAEISPEPLLVAMVIDR